MAGSSSPRRRVSGTLDTNQLAGRQWTQRETHQPAEKYIP